MMGFVGVVMHYVFEGPRREQPSSADQADRSAATTSREGELDGDFSQSLRSIAPTPSTEWGAPSCMSASCLRHPVYTRFLHWMVGIFFFLALLSGFGIYLPWIFRFFTPLFGGGAMTRFLHPWFGLGFVIFFGLQALNWLAGRCGGRLPTPAG